MKDRCHTLYGRQESLSKRTDDETKGEDQTCGSDAHQGVTSGENDAGYSDEMDIEKRALSCSLRVLITS